MKKIPYLVIDKIDNSIYPDLIMEELIYNSKKKLHLRFIIFPDIILILLIMVIFKQKSETIMIVILFLPCQKISFDILNLKKDFEYSTRKGIEIQINQTKKHELIHSFLSILFNFNHAIIIMNYNISHNYTCSGFTLITKEPTSILKRVSFTILNFFYDLISYFKNDLKFGSIDPFYIVCKELIQESFYEIRSTLAQEPITTFETYYDIRKYASKQAENNFRELDDLLKNKD